jgi:hypothetical protein
MKSALVHFSQQGAFGSFVGTKEQRNWQSKVQRSIHPPG